MVTIQTAAAAFQAGNFQEAERICRSLLGKAPGDPRALVLLGMTLGNSGRLEEGIAILRTAVERHPDVGPIRANLALLLSRQGFQLQALGQFQEARSLLEQSIRIEPRQGMTYSSIALGQKLGEQDKPLVDLLEKVLLDKVLARMDLAYLHFAIGKAREDAGSYEHAMNHYDEANRLAFEANPSTRFFRLDLYRESLRKLASLITQESRSLLQDEGEEGPQPIFVLGLMRSGTTLVEQILSSHQDVAGAGELDYWMRAGAEAVRSSGGRITPEIIGRLRDGYLGVLRSQANGAKWVTDKMPQNYQWIGLIQLAFPSAPIIHLNRNKLDNALSIWTTPYERPPDFVHNKANIIGMMGVHLELMNHWRSSLPAGRILDVQYEDLVANPEPLTQKVLEYCGLTWDDRCLSPEKNKRAVHTASYWQARQPVYTSSVARWQRFEPWLGEFKEFL